MPVPSLPERAARSRRRFFRGGKSRSSSSQMRTTSMLSESCRSPVPEAPDFPPRNIRAEIGGEITELRGSLADRQQRVFNGENLFVISVPWPHDPPVHPHLPETAYLKAQLLQLTQR